MTKIEPASPEEQAFAFEVNHRLTKAGAGAMISVFTRLDTETQVRQYGVVMQCGSKRHTVTSDSPFHYDAANDMLALVNRWIKGRGGGELYSADPKYGMEFEDG